MTYLNRLQAQSRWVTVALSLFFFTFVVLVIYIYNTEENLGIWINVTFGIGLAIVVLYFLFFSVFWRTWSAARIEYRLSQHTISIIRNLFESEEDIGKIVDQLKHCPSDVLRQMAKALSPQKKDQVLKQLVWELQTIERWMGRNTEPDGESSTPELEEMQLRTTKNQEELLRLRNILDGWKT